MNENVAPPPRAPDSLWYYADASNAPVGPVPFVELQRLAAAGVIHAATHVIESGGSEWKKFASVLLPPPPAPVELTPPPAIQSPSHSDTQPLTVKVLGGIVSELEVTLFEDRIRITR